MNNTNQDILLEIYKEVKSTKEQVKKISTDEIPQIKKQLEKIPNIEKQIGKIPYIEEQLEEVKQELRNISRSVAKIEVEHGEKLAILFDTFKVNTEKIEEQNKRITRCENILEKHDEQIYILNSKIQNT